MESLFSILRGLELWAECLPAENNGFSYWISDDFEDASDLITSDNQQDALEKAILNWFGY